MGAGALLLPPLALGAAFYSMLAPPDEEPARGPAAAAQAAAPQPAAAPPLTAQAAAPQPAAPPAAAALLPPSAAGSRDEAAPSRIRVPVQSAPAPVAAGPIVVTPAAAVNNAQGDLEVSVGAAPPAAESPPLAAAVVPKRPAVHKRAKPPQDPVLNWLQEIGTQMGILPRKGDGKDGRG